MVDPSEEARRATQAFADHLREMVLEGLGPLLRFLAEHNERAALLSFGSSEQRWLVVMVTRELVDTLGDQVIQLQDAMRAAAAKAGISALDEETGAHVERARKRQRPKGEN